jgi:RHS repeat-associated protein
MSVTNYIGIDDLLYSEIEAGTRRDYMTDSLGSVSGTVAASGLKINSYLYNPFGGVLSKSGPDPDPNFLWAGRYAYWQTGTLYSEKYVRARHYSNLTGSWTTIDPLWPAQLAYAYVDGRVIYQIDPSGLSGCCCCEPESIGLANISLPYGSVIPFVIPINGQSICNPSDPEDRWGHYFEIQFKVNAQSTTGSSTTDCSLEWWECSNFGITPAGSQGVWVLRTDFMQQKCLNDWKNPFSCTGGRSGYIADEPSLTKLRLMNLYADQRNPRRDLAIYVRIKNGSGCPVSDIKFTFYQQLRYNPVAYSGNTPAGFEANWALTPPSSFFKNCAGAPPGY